MRGCLRSLGVVLLLAALPSALSAGQPAGQQNTHPISAAEAAPFVGEWTLDLQGPNGPGTFTLSITVEDDKVKGEIASDQLPKQAVSSIALADKSLVVGYSFTWEGNPVDAVVTLTPAENGKTSAQIDFAGGAYVMTGSATKKAKQA